MICFKKNKIPQHVQHDEPVENDIDFSLDLDFEPPTATHAYHKLRLLADMVIISTNQTTYPPGQV